MIGLQICSICTYILYLSGVNLIPIEYLSIINLFIIMIMTIDLYSEFKSNTELKIKKGEEDK